MSNACCHSLPYSGQTQQMASRGSNMPPHENKDRIQDRKSEVKIACGTKSYGIFHSRATLHVLRYLLRKASLYTWNGLDRHRMDDALTLPQRGQGQQFICNLSK